MALVGQAIILGRALEQHMTERLKPHRLIYTDFDVLATLRRAGDPYTLSPSALRASVLLTSGAMSAALDRLERKGLLTRTPSPTDRRSMAARLTPRGVTLAEELVAIRFAEAQDVAALLPAAQRKATAAALKRLLGALAET
ncbi:MAG: MarR family transcriptional regulator [Pseudomonadota bacterium]